MKEFLRTWRTRLFEPVDIASIVFFRIVFGLIMVWHVLKYYFYGVVHAVWGVPRFLYKFYGFSWVEPWPGHWLEAHWLVIGLAAFFVAIGFCYRASAVVMFLSYTYFFLLDEARYVNHTYLICLFCLFMIFIRAHRALSVDAWLRPRLRSNSAPAWSLWLLRFQMGVVYFFAGVAKLNPDWLRGEPMRYRLAARPEFPLVGAYFKEEWMVYLASYGALLLDLCIVPFLLWRKTRLPAFLLILLFHILNAKLFPIGIFPWVATAVTLLYFSPSWPRQVLGLVRRGVAYRPPENWRLPSRGGQRIMLAVLVSYVILQLLLPFRHLLWRGGYEWTWAEHRFSWRMMLLTHGSTAAFYVTDPNTGRTTRANVREFLTKRQMEMLGYLPDFAVQFAHYLATVMPRRGPKPLQVEARIMVSINGRKPQLYLDPNVDLAAEERHLLSRPKWLRVIDDPLPPLGERYMFDKSTPLTGGYQ